jgi:hypothetical protein
MRSANGLSVGLVLVLVAGVTGGAADELDDWKVLQGTWDIVYLERSGSEVKPQKDTTALRKSKSLSTCQAMSEVTTFPETSVRR